MALKAAYEIRCSCGAAFSGDVFEYVFVQHDPELRDAVLSGEFNRVPCPSCGQRLAVETRFLYRDEAHRLWIWVCRKDEEAGRDSRIEERVGKDTFMDCHFLEDREAYRQYIVFGRDGLLELLLKEDPDLQRSEKKELKRNPAFRWIRAQDEDPGFIIFTGRKIRVSMPLRFPEARGTILTTREEKNRWLRHYAHGLNVHNPYSSFLDKRLKTKWNRIRERKPLTGVDDEFADFAESWACLKTDARRFSARHPERRAFFDGLKNLDISRKLRPLVTRRNSRDPGGNP